MEESAKEHKQKWSKLDPIPMLLRASKLASNAATNFAKQYESIVEHRSKDLIWLKKLTSTTMFSNQSTFEKYWHDAFVDATATGGRLLQQSFDFNQPESSYSNNTQFLKGQWHLSHLGDDEMIADVSTGVKLGNHFSLNYGFA